MGVFGSLVRKDGPWDHKPAILQMTFHSKGVWTPLPGDPYKKLIKYDIWSNIHYGYVGRSLGIPASTLMSVQRDFGISTFADDVSVRLGIDLWARYGGNLRRSNLLQGVLDRILVYRRIHFGGYSGHRVLITGVSFLVPTWP
jgi:hypothetical protein